ncbi:MAG TPA: hypothetical protein VGQ46_13260 [Thermoanaerobaculia bacterium]|nr:hypothetical protein [Thermoanaerobaculia bacterium]
MNSFILKLFFTGLMAFVPSQDGKEVTVLLLNVHHDYQSSDGTALAHHKPLLIARAGDCSGQCPKRDADIAQFIYADKSESEALDSLEAAVAGGGAWELSNSELSIEKADPNAPDLPALNVVRNVRTGIIPTTSAEREDFGWVAEMQQIAPSGYAFNTELLDSPPPGLVAARLHLRSGKVFTYRVARIGSNVTPVHFQRLDGTGDASPYSQAIASWVGAEIEISGENVEIVEEKFDGGTGRSMTLSPDADGKVEVAVLNLPPFVAPSTPFAGTPDPGKHFEMYYEVAQTPPAQSARLVPKAGAAPGAAEYAEVAWNSIHPTALWSDLLNALRLNIGRTAYEEVLCPPFKP